MAYRRRLAIEGIEAAGLKKADRGETGEMCWEKAARQAGRRRREVTIVNGVIEMEKKGRKGMWNVYTGWSIEWLGRN